MGSTIERLPALPLIANDPYFSIWLPGDTLTSAAPVHWSGAPKPMSGHIVIDGTPFVFFGKSSRPEMRTTSLRVTPTRTISVMEAAGVELTVVFWSPALPGDLDALSTPITFVDFSLQATDGKPHDIALRFNASAALCHEGQTRPAMIGEDFVRDGLRMSFIGQAQQRVLGHSGDHITIDWGYLYLAAEEGEVSQDNGNGLSYRLETALGEAPVQAFLMLGYDDVASINYFGTFCKAWGLRDGRTLPGALADFARRHGAFLAACEALDEQVLARATALGGEDYARIAAAAWRHTFAAHKLIATPEGEMAFLSKENDSNGCIGTVDVSYPSVPLFLKFCPELVNALCRPVLQFASMPVWEADYAPHDVGRYPFATGQVYAARRGAPNGYTHRPFYLYPAGTDAYDPRYQMPVEECGNVLIMLEAALSFGAEDRLIRKYAPLLAKWVRYLDTYGEDPGEQLCTDDFAGHLARNVNLSAKAVVGVACYARILRRLGEREEAQRWETRAREMAGSWLERAGNGESTALTFDGAGWSMKYNLVWDRVLDLGLLPDEFYDRETRSYLDRMNEFGLPLDSRADYTKSDWLVWCASMARDPEVFRKLIAPLAHYLRATPSRVPFSDWYDTRTGRYVAFIARSVQGGLYMPMLLDNRDLKFSRPLLNRDLRFMPFMILLDTSDAMKGHEDQLRDDLQALVDIINDDNFSRRHVDLCVLTFGGAATVLEGFGPMDSFKMPSIPPCGGKACMYEAIRKALDLIDARKDVYRSSGISYDRPCILMLTGGHPDDPDNGASESLLDAQRKHKCTFFGVGLGDEADTELLKQLNINNYSWDFSALKEMIIYAFRSFEPSYSKISHVGPGEMVTPPNPADYCITIEA